jgi:hypothetical protein
MATRRRDQNASHRGYQRLTEEEDNPRASLNSNSPILPKEELEEDIEHGPSTQNATFDTDGLEQHYTPIKGYEGAHRYDPSYTWDPKNEKQVVWKVRDLLLKSEQILNSFID